MFLPFTERPAGHALLLVPASPAGSAAGKLDIVSKGKCKSEALSVLVWEEVVGVNGNETRGEGGGGTCVCVCVCERERERERERGT